MTETPDKFQSWAFLELMGHRKLAGFVQETEIASGKFLRIDVTDSSGQAITQFYRPEAVYCITPTTEAMVKAYQDSNRAAPVSRYELAFKEAEVTDVGQHDDDDDDDDDEGDYSE